VVPPRLPLLKGDPSAGPLADAPFSEPIMRTTLLWTLPALLCGLPAQAPQRPADPAPLTRAEGHATATVQQATAAHAQLGSRQQQHVRFDRPRADGPLWALGTAWKASFDGTGCTVIPFFGSTAPRNFPLRLELTSASVGGESLPLADGEPVQKNASVHTDRGSLTEVIDTRLDSLEQSFVFAQLPTRDAIAVDVRITSELTVSPLANGLRFANELGHVDYTKAVALDAAGRQLPLAIEWTGTSARMVIPASFVAEAQLPIVLDPVLIYWYGIGSSSTLLQHDSDVASIQATSLGGRTLMIWQRQWSATDQDAWGVMFDGALSLVQTDFNIDFTGFDWLKISVAGNNYASNFLVVAEVRDFLLHYIAGRGIDANAAVGSVFDIEREGVVGTPGNNYHPDVGSDPYFGVGRYTVVFNKKTLGVSDIYMRQITTSGGQVTPNAVAIDTATTEEQKPSISKSCGQSNGLPARWLISYQRTWGGTPFDQEVWGRHVEWNGALPGISFPIATTVNEESAPAAGSPIDSNGTRLWPVCFETATTLGQQRDIALRLYDGNGAFVAGQIISNNVPNSDDREPQVDSDGVRTVAIYTVGTSGFPQGIEAVTVAWLPTTASFRIEERTGLITSGADNYGEGNVCADYSGGSGVSPKYFLSFSEQTSNTLRLEAYAGHAGGTTFFTTRPSQCGSLGISASGSPVLGQTLTVTAANGPLSGTVVGVPGFIPLNVLGCNCWQGVDQFIYFGNPFVWTVPTNTAYVGIPLSVQGWTIAGTQCLGFVDLSDTVDFTIQ
jgi:hypothetical protein